MSRVDRSGRACNPLPVIDIAHIVLLVYEGIQLSSDPILIPASDASVKVRHPLEKAHYL